MSKKKSKEEEVSSEQTVSEDAVEQKALEDIVEKETASEPIKEIAPVVVVKETHVEKIARICHETNRAYCAATGDHSQLPWSEAPSWQKISAIKGVEFHIANPYSTPADSHKSWLKQKNLEGWKFGHVKDEKKKEHPCFVDYNDLPKEQQVKDHIFTAIVKALA